MDCPVQRNRPELSRLRVGEAVPRRPRPCWRRPAKLQGAPGRTFPRGRRVRCLDAPTLLAPNGHGATVKGSRTDGCAHRCPQMPQASQPGPPRSLGCSPSALIRSAQFMCPRSRSSMACVLSFLPSTGLIHESCSATLMMHNACSKTKSRRFGSASTNRSGAGADPSADIWCSPPRRENISPSFTQPFPLEARDQEGMVDMDPLA